MAETPINLAAARAAKAKDGALWSPRDCLLQLVADIDAGAVAPNKICIHMLTEMPDGGWKHNFYQAGLSRMEHVAVLAMGQKSALEDWVR